MREIKFRGKDLTENEWKYGSYNANYHTIHDENGWRYIKDETVGQYTGLKDKNGVEIYEGDIVKFSWMIDDDLIGVVEFREYDEIISEYYSASGYGWCIHSKTELKEICNTSYYESLTADVSCFVEVIGNIYDNPELLEELK